MSDNHGFRLVADAIRWSASLVCLTWALVSRSYGTEKRVMDEIAEGLRR